MISVEQLLNDKYPTLFEPRKRLLARPLVQVFRMLFHEKEINSFLDQHQGIGPFAFIEQVLDYFDFSYSLNGRELDNIPSAGRVVIVANHPLGALDALALIHLVTSVRRDVKVIANDMLMALPPLAPLLLPVDNLGGETRKAGIKRIRESFARDEAVIIFPAGEVSRPRATGIRDGDWNSGFVRFAKRAQAPVLPIHIEARNSAAFYGLSLLYRPLSAILLVNEMFRQRAKMVGFHIGESIPCSALSPAGISDRGVAKLMRSHIYRIAKGRRGHFVTEKGIAQPEQRKMLKQILKQAERLGETQDGKAIFLCDYAQDSPLIREIGRLRELTFRSVGEGSGQRRDMDRYDHYYRHLVLWDEEELELVGAYRIGEMAQIVAERGVQGLYTHSLFDFDERFTDSLGSAIELGRSFVQPRYWGTRALDYLWQGIGAYLARRPEIRFMFGPVSISQSYPSLARSLLVSYYGHHFAHLGGEVRARHALQMSAADRQLCGEIIRGERAEDDLPALRKALAQLGVTIPTLYKQYSELCEPGGVAFHGFSVDPDFQNCIDGFIVVDVSKVKESKRRRYIDGHRDGQG